MVNNNIRFIAVFGVLVSTASVGHAQLNFNEAVNGDLSFFKRLTLGVGVNTISGTSTIGHASDFDPFILIVPAGSFLASANYSYFAVQPNSPSGTIRNSFGPIFRLERLAPPTLVSSEVKFPVYSTFDSTAPASQDLFGDALPVFAGDYRIRNVGFNVDLANPGGSFGYRWTLYVSPVPEVSSFQYVILGCLGTFFALRRNTVGRSTVKSAG